MLRIAETKPGELLLLKWKGLPQRLIARLLISLFLLPFVLMLGFAAVQITLSWVRTPDMNIILPGAATLLFVLLFFFIIAGVLVLVNYLSSSWTRVRFDSRSKELWIRHGGLVPLSTRIPFSSIRSMKFDVGAEVQTELKIEFRIGYESEQGKSKEKQQSVQVYQCNRRTEAMDLIFHMARILGWAGYHVPRNDHRSLQIVLEQSAVDNDALAIPAAGGMMDYSVDATPTHFREPEISIPPFVPGTFEADSSRPPKIEWEPGNRVQFWTPPLSVFQCCVAALPVGFGAGVLAFFAATILQWAFIWPITIGIGLAAALGGAAVKFILNPEREALFDWSLGTCTFRDGRKQRTLRLNEIQEMILRGCKRHVSGGKNRKSYDLYWCELITVLPGPDETLVSTDSFREDPDHPYKMSIPMCVDLARSLNIRWRWEEYP